ncbi:MAG: hypothetical protein IJP96_00740 [Synergistaceae bacterium]|nr:hypothetical protein [Synergistaceae bacterium]
MIYTSYYSNRNLKKIDGSLRLVGISQGIPKWYHGEVFKKLAPTWAMVKMTNEDDYTALYKSQILSGLDPIEIAKLLDNSILLCWEKPGDFCHRRLVAKWLEEATGQEVPEWGEDTNKICF